VNKKAAFARGRLFGCQWNVAHVATPSLECRTYVRHPRLEVKESATFHIIGHILQIILIPRTIPVHRCEDVSGETPINLKDTSLSPAAAVGKTYF